MEIAKNNRVENLEWVSPAENSCHARNVLNKTGNIRPVIQYTLDGTYIQRFESTTSAARSLNINTISQSCISRACKVMNNVGGFQWRYENELEAPIISENGKEIPEFPKYLAAQRSQNGYLFVFLSNDWDRRMMLIHRIIAITFIPNPENKSEVNHKNCQRDDNRVENLEWSTRGENMLHVAMVGNSHSKPVVEVIETGEIISNYPSIKEAARCTGISTDSISRRCNGNASPIKGRYFRYSQNGS